MPDLTKDLTIRISHDANVLADKLDRFNEWWGTGKVRDRLVPPYHREPFGDVMKRLDYRQALILVGLRRVGKTTILYQVAKEVLQGTEPNRLVYFSFEEGGEEAAEVLREYENRVLKRPIGDAGRVFVLFDEVQYSKDWVQVVKRYYDIYPNVKFLLSGSSSLMISGRALSSLAGRFFFVDVYPMKFKEFVEQRGEIAPGGETDRETSASLLGISGKGRIPGGSHLDRRRQGRGICAGLGGRPGPLRGHPRPLPLEGPAADGEAAVLSPLEARVRRESG